MTPTPLSPALAAVCAAAGAGAASTDPAALAPHLIDWRGRVRGRAAAIVWPRTTAAVAAIVRAAAAHGVALVPQGATPASSAAASPTTAATR